MLEQKESLKTYRVSLVKSYSVIIEAENETKARELSEFFTGDIQDLSEEKHRNENKFSIAEIECIENEAVYVEEIKNE